MITLTRQKSGLPAGWLAIGSRQSGLEVVASNTPTAGNKTVNETGGQIIKSRTPRIHKPHITHVHMLTMTHFMIHPDPVYLTDLQNFSSRRKLSHQVTLIDRRVDVLSVDLEVIDHQASEVLSLRLFDWSRGGSTKAHGALTLPVSWTTTLSASAIGNPVSQCLSAAEHVASSRPVGTLFSWEPLALSSIAFSTSTSLVGTWWPESSVPSFLLQAKASFLVCREAGSQLWAFLACHQDLLLKVSHKAGIFISIFSHGVDECVFIIILFFMP